MQPGDPRRAEPRRPRLLWVWRGFLALGALAAALMLFFAAQGNGGAAAKWGVIAVGWAAIGWWLRTLDVSSR